MEITLVCRAETEYDFLRKIIGRKNEMLNDTGRRQSRLLRAKLSNYNYDLCFMSPSVRCVETAFILIGDRVITYPDERLYDRNMGELVDKSISEYNEFKFWDYEFNKNTYSVEPIHSIFDRCSDFLDYIKEKYIDKKIIIVVDYEIYRALRHLILQHSLTGNLFDNRINNCQFEKFNI